jgi:hypothetical protein
MQPNYYAIIPAEVRYSAIKPNAKLLFGELTALSNKHGYSFASNNYFAELYSVSKNTISLWIKELSDAGFVSSQLIKEKNQIIERRLYITLKSDTIIKNDERGIIKNDEYNNTSINTIKKNININERKFNFKFLIWDLKEISIETKNEFFNYWSEANHSNTKMKFELEKTWDLQKRINRWILNSKKWAKPEQKSKVEMAISNHQKALKMIQNYNNNTND